ncbi:MAG: hypothetical protein HY758_00925 [Nitrospirae bacterium]|nr:hypothetical protein [Nitrospirota bacterium]
MGRDKQNDLTIKLLERINHDIENFIKSSIEASSDISRWSDLHREFEHIKCWEIKGCAKKDCPAYQNEDYRCWLIAGTFCGGVVQGEFAKKYGTCFKCNIFQNIFGQQPVRRLYENIDILISHLHNRAVQLREMARSLLS